MPDGDPLADLHRHDLQHAFEPGAHSQGVGLAPPQIVERPALGHAGLFGRQLRVGRARADLQAFGLDAMAVGEFLGLDLGNPCDDGRLQAFLGQLLVGFGLDLRAVVQALDIGGLRLLLEQFVVQAHIEAGEIGFGPSQLQLGVEQLLQHALVAQLEDDRVGLDDVGARQRDDALDRGFGGRGDPPDVFGHERARASDLAQHRPALGRVAPGRGGSTVGAAGFNCARPTVTNTPTNRAATPKMMRLTFFFFAIAGER